MPVFYFVVRIKKWCGSLFLCDVLFVFVVFESCLFYVSWGMLGIFGIWGMFGILCFGEVYFVFGIGGCWGILGNGGVLV